MQATRSCNGSKILAVIVGREKACDDEAFIYNSLTSVAKFSRDAKRSAFRSPAI